ncbi:IscS subfamily cysteine desulfurase [Tuwongella immobilis]|uniref:Cysteine desulfurase IscS n=1 Tax=Tuwongella immobilis TaxID=692036 RepID=A0A6C2YMY4_9BACT|nr:IscS subfamily cysteine desulfurase [Tuwongella immobilis]VIP02970.1 cysteine desulfurase : Cysteine desulfurase IscS OS=Acidobacterium capsulatum (strain ATCC 51196 / DSM 11244 / JCM 7670) GN=icsS2 PE=3 SV=1: Aminotran_5 [Tuwongella immobilis]VTS02998.1 cysteine desulfurase : Cysteine desulfurase IscS OS=Acidobacterium capsulatum (strain ATCC 51196 / DSM 11244 / JCM 7670) GN=icsS2 PE=3 SV=1: Aminotran_5 [Tuwongella immobilis]
MLKFPIYMDNNSTTRTDPRVVDAMLPYFTEKFGNAASRNHAYGWEAEEAVELAREQIAAIIGASGKEIIFTSGATESNNLAIKGVAHMYRKKGNHIITAATEHKAVLDPCKRLEQEGFQVTVLPVDPQGRVSAEQVEAAMTDQTILVSIMTANNEIGTIQPIAEIGKLCKSRGVLFHTDAVQAVGKIPMDVEAMGIDLLSLTGHKLYGPKGIGALYVRKKNPRVRLDAIIDGGGHERGMRSGTLPVPMIVGLGKACEIARLEMPEETQRLFRLREKLREGIMGQLPETYLNGHPTERLPGNANISFAFVEGEGLMMGIKDIACSSGSACTSASLEPSYVLRALGVGDELAHSSIRFGIGRFNTEEEVDFVVDRVVKEVTRLREMSPLFEMAQQGIDLKTVQWAAH